MPRLISIVLLACGAAIGAVSLRAAVMTDGPLTSFFNLRGRTDENGYVRLSIGAAGVTDGPLTAFSSLRARTDENGYLRVSLPSGSVAPTDATYITQTPNSSLSAEQALSTLATGLLNVTTTTGVVSSFAPTDDNLLVGSGTVWALKALSDCQGTGKAVTYTVSTNAFGCNTISGASPAGSGSELQLRSDATTFAALTGSSFASSTLNLGADNLLTVRRVAETVDAVVSIYDNGSGKTNLIDVEQDNDSPYMFHAWNRTYSANGSNGFFAYIANTGDLNMSLNAPGFSFDVTGSSTTQSFGMKNPERIGVGFPYDAGIFLESGDKYLELTQALSDPSASVVTQAGTPGAATVTYKLVGNTPLGYHSAAGAASTTTTANATLNGSNYNIIASPALAGVVSYDIYRTVGGPSQGLIQAAVSSFPFNDTGIAGDASTPTAVNTTGHVYAGAIFDGTTDITLAGRSIVPLIGTTGSIGGGLLAGAGSCATGTASVTGALVGMPVAASTSDGSAVSGLVAVYASVTSSGTVTVQVCAIAAVTPAAKTWNVAVIPR